MTNNSFWFPNKKEGLYDIFYVKEKPRDLLHFPLLNFKKSFCYKTHDRIDMLVQKAIAQYTHSLNLIKNLYRK